jgi:hypothetical protein
MAHKFFRFSIAVLLPASQVYGKPGGIAMTNTNKDFP